MASGAWPLVSCDVADRLTEWFLYAIVVFSPWAFGTTQVWAAKESDGSYAVALFNLGTTDTRTVGLSWEELGLTAWASRRCGG